MKSTLLLRRRCRRRGFTLMEILLVLAILVILGALVGVAYNKIQRNAYIDSAKAQIKLLDTGIRSYQLDVGKYPSTDQGLDGLLNPPADAPPGKWRGPYLDATQLPLDPWGNPYNYTLLSPDEFEITSNGPDSAPGTDDDVRIIK
jgi:general secretion pathway protein G